MKRWLKENRGFLIFLLCFGLFRTAVADWNPIPSSSMRPTLLEGDVVLVDRLAYDLKLPLTDISLAALGEPQRGDVITFSSPDDGTRLIKRLVAVPGDVVELRDGRLFLNGKASEYSGVTEVVETMDSLRVRSLHATERLGDKPHVVQYLPALPGRRDFAPLTVPPGHYFFLGDNRDNSADSRYFGLVPRRLLIGRAHHVVVSADITSNWLPRVGRFGRRID